VLVLAIDTATPRIAVALGDGGRVLGEVQLVTGAERGRAARRHAELLAPAIRSLCDQLQVSLDHLAAVAVGIGPGLFTGLRVGVTTALTVARSLRLPVVAVPSLDLVAYPLRHSARLIVTVLDARRGEVFWASYRPVPGGVQRVSEYQVQPPAEVVAELAAGGEELLLAGDGVSRYPEEFAALERAEVAGPSFDAPSAVALVELATAKVVREEFVSPGDVRPLYLRQSDAEIMWERV
jgi:tRNA threonylcarbamoyladenosine biosynthesis protein TsaB